MLDVEEKIALAINNNPEISHIRMTNSGESLLYMKSGSKKLYKADIRSNNGNFDPQEQQYYFTLDTANVLEFQISRNDQYLLVSKSERELYIYHIETKTKLRHFQFSDVKVSNVQFLNPTLITEGVNISCEFIVFRQKRDQ